MPERALLIWKTSPVTLLVIEPLCSETVLVTNLNPSAAAGFLRRIEEVENQTDISAGVPERQFEAEKLRRAAPTPAMVTSTAPVVGPFTTLRLLGDGASKLKILVKVDGEDTIATVIPPALIETDLNAPTPIACLQNKVDSEAQSEDVVPRAPDPPSRAAAVPCNWQPLPTRVRLFDPVGGPLVEEETEEMAERSNEKRMVRLPRPPRPAAEARIGALAHVRAPAKVLHIAAESEIHGDIAEPAVPATLTPAEKDPPMAPGPPKSSAPTMVTEKDPVWGLLVASADDGAERSNETMLEAVAPTFLDVVTAKKNAFSLIPDAACLQPSPESLVQSQPWADVRPPTRFLGEVADLPPNAAPRTVIVALPVLGAFPLLTELTVEASNVTALVAELMEVATEVTEIEDQGRAPRPAGTLQTVADADTQIVAGDTEPLLPTREIRRVLPALPAPKTVTEAPPVQAVLAGERLEIAMRSEVTASVRDAAERS